MKQSLSGSNWRVSHFLPDEAAPVMPWIEQITQGAEYGAYSDRFFRRTCA
jgi:hypothetical protein